MLQGEHSAILSTFMKLPFVIKIFVLSILESPFHTGFTVLTSFPYTYVGIGVKRSKRESTKTKVFERNGIFS